LAIRCWAIARSRWIIAVHPAHTDSSVSNARAVAATARLGAAMLADVADNLVLETLCAPARPAIMSRPGC
jgi:hypothetical protein